jgi:hypothetical protein
MDGPLACWSLACWSAPKAPSGSFLAARLHLLLLLHFLCFYFPPFVSAPLALSRPDRSCPSWQVAIRMLQGRKCASGCRLVVPLVGLGKKAFLVAAILQQPPFHSSLLNDLLNILQIFREKICQLRTAILRQKKLLRPMEPESFEQEAAEHSREEC